MLLKQQSEDFTLLQIFLKKTKIVLQISFLLLNPNPNQIWVTDWKETFFPSTQHGSLVVSKRLYNYTGFIQIIEKPFKFEYIRITLIIFWFGFPASIWADPYQILQTKEKLSTGRVFCCWSVSCTDSAGSDRTADSVRGWSRASMVATRMFSLGRRGGRWNMQS